MLSADMLVEVVKILTFCFILTVDFAPDPLILSIILIRHQYTPVYTLFGNVCHSLMWAIKEQCHICSCVGPGDP